MSDEIFYFHGPWEGGDGISETPFIDDVNRSKIERDSYVASMDYWGDFLSELMNAGHNHNL